MHVACRCSHPTRSRKRSVSYAHAPSTAGTVGGGGSDSGGDDGCGVDSFSGVVGASRQPEHLSM
jgi:hypothetical protein